ncbi:hypothetical protein AB4212_29610, partial [Streptomyces sp. 2MCAF27]
MRARRNVTAGLAVMAVLAALANCAGSSHDSQRSGNPGQPRTDRDAQRNGPAAPKHPKRGGKQGRLIGDGSTSYTGPQPGQLRPRRLKPGDKPPQFVVFSWDGAGQDGQKLFSRFRAVAKKYDATMTYFLSGVYMLPAKKQDLYDPPRHSRGSSA